MWQQILEYFSDSPSQQKVIRFLIENGFGISPKGKAVINGVEITASALSRALDTDRRVIESALKRAWDNDILRPIFANLKATPDFTNIAKELGLSVITIIPNNAEDKNIVAAAIEVITAYDLNLRQIFVTDPYATEQPRLVIIIDGRLPAPALDDLHNLPAVKSIIL